MPDTLASTWARTVSSDPAATALIDAATGRTWSRGALAQEVLAWRAALPAAALRRRAVVMAEPNGPAWWRVFLGLLAADAVPVPVDPTEPPDNQLAIARSIGAGWCWRDGELVAAAAQPRRWTAALIKLTSGSTGVPKARPFTSAQMLADGRQICATMDVRPDDLNLAVIPPGHSYGLGNLVIPLLAQGTPVLCVGSPLPQAIAADCARWRPTVFPAVPAVLRALVLAEVDPAALASLRLVISAGAPLPAAIATAFAEKYGRRVHGFYGTTETGGIAFDRSGEATLTGRSVGRPLEGVTIAFGRGKRFHVAGPAVAAGRHRPADHARWNEAGELELLGRSGRIVKLAGRRLDLGEIESVLRALPGVRDAYATIGAGRRELLQVAVATDAGTTELKAAARERLAAWKLPRRWSVMRDFPLTVRGKTDTRRLRALLAGA